jgi:hypothetical protein
MLAECDSAESVFSDKRFLESLSLPGFIIGREKEAKKIVLKVKGKILQGKYCLLHFKPKEKNWLFFKIKDM